MYLREQPTPAPDLGPVSGPVRGPEAIATPSLPLLAHQLEDLLARLDVANKQLTSLVLRLYGPQPTEADPKPPAPSDFDTAGIVARIEADVNALWFAEDTLAGLVRELERVA